MRLRPVAKSLPQVMAEFLTPQVFKQVRKVVSRRKQPRWDIHPLLLVLLTMSWCCGDSLAEKFEAARGFYVVCHEKRKRPGRSLAGFEKALSRLPMPVLRSLAAVLRTRILAVFNQRLFYHGFIPLGCDGTRQECPRTEELERRLGTFGKDGSAPMIWNTAIVHLTLGIPFCWKFGRGGKASERAHLLSMLDWLPRLAIVVTDAGYIGYDVMRRLCERNTSFLMRMSSNATFYTDLHTQLEQFCEGIVYYWPKTVKDAGQPPLRGRLLRIRSARHKVDVWLFTNVLDSERLPLTVAAQLYRWRWKNEGFFRTYKRTLNKVKLVSHTLRLVHREAEASMLSIQLLLCQGAWAVSLPTAKAGADEPMQCSPRKVLLEIRRELTAATLRADYSQRLAKAKCEHRERTSTKEKRVWTRRKPHKPPKPPHLLQLDDELKSKISQCLTAV
jgi:hypothetical protein